MHWHFKRKHLFSCFVAVWLRGSTHLVYLMCDFRMHPSIIKLLENVFHLTASVVHSVVESQVEQITLKLIIFNFDFSLKIKLSQSEL